MLATKDFAGFLQHFAGLARQLFAVPVPNAEKSLSVETVVGAARKIGIAAQPAKNIAAALTATSRLQLDPPPRILMGGSLYLAGEVLAQNGTPPE
jgi:dihydrofolate synthase/folylpolyglutamate synthase